MQVARFKKGQILSTWVMARVSSVRRSELRCASLICYQRRMCAGRGDWDVQKAQTSRAMPRASRKGLINYAHGT